MIEVGEDLPFNVRNVYEVVLEGGKASRGSEFRESHYYCSVSGE